MATDPLPDRLTEALIKHRWAVVVPLVLPLSRAYDAYFRTRHIRYRNFRKTAQEHDARVQDVQAQVRRWNERGRPGLLCTSRRSWQSVSVRAVEYKATQYGVRVDLDEILEVDTERRVVRVEPRVNMGQLTARLVPMGFTLPIVPELDDLTASGLLLGYGIESSAHKVGLFADIVRSAEVVLADGRRVTASPDQNADLFRALPFSGGALGFLTSLELAILPAKPYVRLTYEPISSLDAMCARFEEEVSKENAAEFVEAILFEKERGVLMTGDFADLPRGERPNDVGKWSKPWFYKHAEALAARGRRHVEHVPLRAYYHRHTRSVYWHGELLVPFGNHPLFRHTLGWLMPPKVNILRLLQGERIRRYRDARNIVQDALVPLRLLREGIERFHEWFECYPLWLCGHRTHRTEPQGMICPADRFRDWEMYVDIGAWQVPGPVKRGELWDGHRAVRKMEAWLRENHGYQCPYAVTEQTEAEFWQMFDGTLYREVRHKYGAEGAFVDVYARLRGRSSSVSSVDDESGEERPLPP